MQRDNKDGGDKKKVIVIIPGNPGYKAFYDEFALELYNTLDKEIPIIQTGHLGQERLCRHYDRNLPPLNDNKQLYGLDNQVKHKIDIIKNAVPENHEIFLVGHSIGSWMILEMLKNTEIRKQTKKCFLLFPTIERMAESPNGQIFCRYNALFAPLLIFLTKLFCLAPRFLRNFIVSLYLYMSSLDGKLKIILRRFIHPEVVQRSLVLAQEEMIRVRDLDIRIIEENKSVLKLYYGTTDGWVPVQYYEEICQKIPEIDAELDSDNIEHAFVLKSSKVMAQKTSLWIKNLVE
uniref:Lipid droplet-associated hydrolase n=2 Tax=Lutzomyia longipalpis TaxID=7200 RepID=A0A1B0CG66_LUTLO